MPAFARIKREKTKTSKSDKSMYDPTWVSAWTCSSKNHTLLTNKIRCQVQILRQKKYEIAESKNWRMKITEKKAVNTEQSRNNSSTETWNKILLRCQTLKILLVQFVNCKYLMSTKKNKYWNKTDRTLIFTLFLSALIQKLLNKLLQYQKIFVINTNISYRKLASGWNRPIFSTKTLAIRSQRGNEELSPSHLRLYALKNLLLSLRCLFSGS